MSRADRGLPDLRESRGHLDDPDSPAVTERMASLEPEVDDCVYTYTTNLREKQLFMWKQTLFSAVTNQVIFYSALYSTHILFVLFIVLS